MRPLILLPLLAWPSLALAGLVPTGDSAPTGGTWPEPLRSLLSWGFALQRQLNGQMRENLALIKETGSIEAIGAIVLAAFLYGIFHAVGPGHGKVVIGSYFVSRRARIAQGLAASLIAAMVQAGSAVVAVAVLAGVAALGPRQVMDYAGWLETASYALITGIGLVMLVRAARNQGCGHSHHHHACCGHDHHDHHDHDHEADGKSLFAMAAAVGFRPCSGAILVLLFTFAGGIAWVGIAATLAMGFGVAITTAGIGLGALGINRLAERLFGASGHAGRIRQGLAIAGALAITLLGASLLIGAIETGPRLTG